MFTSLVMMIAYALGEYFLFVYKVNIKVRVQLMNTLDKHLASSNLNA